MFAKEMLVLLQKSRNAQSCVDRRDNAVSLIKPKSYVIYIETHRIGWSFVFETLSKVPKSRGGKETQRPYTA